VESSQALNVFANQEKHRGWVGVEMDQLDASDLLAYCGAPLTANSSCLTILGSAGCEMTAKRSSCGKGSSSLCVAVSPLVVYILTRAWAGLRCRIGCGLGKRDRSATVPRHPRTHLQRFRLQPSPARPSDCVRIKNFRCLLQLGTCSCSACPAVGVNCFAMCAACLHPCDCQFHALI
jgi:hypothetical protein